ncbi:hypothetical protein [Burkholderia sp. Ac-20379]|uniref:hypothetical protein n=1 Tax=Burkholderia sp. Ac-20379 TaxID=2703900 RepID=UPI00197EBE55|nr:hypothetical protein [Burkholderia sp. Ac-20379]MBN3724181.1 hypothetical protein [Burkholderia sp. Ac-20379]
MVANPARAGVPFIALSLKPHFHREEPPDAIRGAVDLPVGRPAPSPGNRHEADPAPAGRDRLPVTPAQNACVSPTRATI